MCNHHLQCTQTALFSHKLTSSQKDIIVTNNREMCKRGIQCDGRIFPNADPTAQTALMHLNLATLGI